MSSVKAILKAARIAARKLALTSSGKKNETLFAIAEDLENRSEEILAANEIDIQNAKDRLGEVMVDRLRLTKERIKNIANAVREVAALPDPIGRVLQKIDRPNGLKIRKVSVPLGVVAIIYESRPNVTVDGAALCLKSGNACVLKGGKDAYFSSAKIVEIIRGSLERVGMDENCVNMPLDTTRESAYELMTAVGKVDVLVPRGGAGLINACMQNAKVPCIQTGTGICHLFVDESADFEKALAVIENAKTSRPSVCNALEVCLVHEKILLSFLPMLKKRLVDERSENPVQLRLCEKSRAVINGVAATKEDYDTEFLGYVLAVKAVSGLEEAINHIAAHSSGHSDGILTEDEERGKLFCSAVDSAAVYVNASTRFTDGGEFGKGCEIGISTQKLHARGPMGLEELTSYKYIVYGDGQVR